MTAHPRMTRSAAVARFNTERRQMSSELHAALDADRAKMISEVTKMLSDLQATREVKSAQDATERLKAFCALAEDVTDILHGAQADMQKIMKDREQMAAVVKATLDGFAEVRSNNAQAHAHAIVAFRAKLAQDVEQIVTSDFR